MSTFDHWVAVLFLKQKRLPFESQAKLHVKTGSFDIFTITLTCKDIADQIVKQLNVEVSVINSAYFNMLLCLRKDASNSIKSILCYFLLDSDELILLKKNYLDYSNLLSRDIG